MATCAQLAAAAPPAQIAWQPIAKSTAGRPIEMAQFGQGARSYLVIGPLYGDARDASELIERLTEEELA
ncbi:MAG: hypothetical protein HY000_38220, partial [Planctomycetes bacterium]|nr:hypothetical protein [Planctomycetota bacterium]